MAMNHSPQTAQTTFAQLIGKITAHVAEFRLDEHLERNLNSAFPLEPGAKFDGRDAGWLVYGPGSALSRGVALCLD
jgi:hypothetical protein